MLHIAPIQLSHSLLHNICPLPFNVHYSSSQSHDFFLSNLFIQQFTIFLYSENRIMISYLANRQYHKLTEMLPKELRGNQPTHIYYQTFEDTTTLDLLQKNKQPTNAHKISKKSYLNKNYPDFTSSGPLRIGRKLTIKKKKAINQDQDLNQVNACPLCFKEHISVAYYGHKHICVKCRNFVRDQYGNQIKIFMQESEKGQKDIVCLGIIPKEVNLQNQKTKPKFRYYTTDHTRLQVMNLSVFATFADQDELILLIRARENNKQEEDNQRK